MIDEDQTSGLWGGPWRTVGVLVAIIAAAGYTSVVVRPRSLPSGLRLDSGLLFHGAVVLVVFGVLYVFLALVTTTFVHSGPPPKMSLGGVFSYEGAAVAAMSQSATALEGIERQVLEIREQLTELVSVAKETQDAIAALADDAGNASVRGASLAAKARLDGLDGDAEAAEREQTTQAIARYRANVELLQQRRSARQALNG